MDGLRDKLVAAGQCIIEFAPKPLNAGLYAT